MILRSFIVMRNAKQLILPMFYLCILVLICTNKINCFVCVKAMGHHYINHCDDEHKNNQCTNNIITMNNVMIIHCDDKNKTINFVDVLFVYNDYQNSFWQLIYTNKTWEKLIVLH